MTTNFRRCRLRGRPETEESTDSDEDGLDCHACTYISEHTSPVKSAQGDVYFVEVLMKSMDDLYALRRVEVLMPSPLLLACSEVTAAEADREIKENRVTTDAYDETAPRDFLVARCPVCHVPWPSHTRADLRLLDHPRFINLSLAAPERRSEYRGQERVPCEGSLRVLPREDYGENGDPRFDPPPIPPPIPPPTPPPMDEPTLSPTRAIETLECPPNGRVFVFLVAGSRYLVLAENAEIARDKAARRWVKVDFRDARIMNLFSGAG